MEDDYRVLMERIRNQKNSLHAMELRRKMLQGLLSAPMDAPDAEYVVITGCHGPFSLVHLANLSFLLRHLGIRFSFLAEETCCGNSYLKGVKKETPKKTVAAMEDFAVESMRTNLDRVEGLGVKKIITACAGCTTTYNHFWGDGSEFDFIYYPQLLLPIIGNPVLKGEINFYEACHKNHRTPRFRIDTASSRELIGKIKRLKIKEIPNICCIPEAGVKKIFEKADTGTIVTPTSCCFAHMRAASNRLKGPRIRTLTDLLNEALGVRNDLF